eukprot:217946-Rhodomonas_salina.1
MSHGLQPRHTYLKSTPVLACARPRSVLRQGRTHDHVCVCVCLCVCVCACSVCPDRADTRSGRHASPCSPARWTTMWRRPAAPPSRTPR